ncbi:DUF397 domain-containing protein [Streptomyces albidoflavus]|uniref:DUF397 domain-containing protein n=1 Tax=Streptomyces albidoflavus TaxID=1886 RepID=UPI00101E5514|nr:DUF397 domain-containing protein [Streptomyces albidoflavus]MCU7702984.1 DUF397 domain-containing protein [Streptomyces albidoflavus]RZD88165.1 DUF397 domain-containing protein [Streptomyces albidoflavus]
MTSEAPSVRNLGWFKSSYSSNAGGDCIEVAYDWRKSSHSGDKEFACVEVAAHPTTVHVRDSKVPAGPVLDVAPAAWAAFVHATVGPLV